MSEKVDEVLQEEQEEMQEMVGMPFNREDMPPGSLVKKWHKDYPNSEIRGFPFPNLYIAYRSYDMKEQEDLIMERANIEISQNREITEFENQRLILKKCVLWPENFIERFDNNNLPGGIPKVITSYILMVSGFVDLVPEVL